jgi:hypothetical protein
MTIISVCSAKGSPGVSTLACALGAVWPPDRQVVVVECDPSGGDLAARFGLSAKRGTTSLMLECRRLAIGAVQVSDHVQILAGGLEVIAGPVGAGAARRVDTELFNCLSHLASPNTWGEAGSHDLVLDCGRIQPGSAGQRAALAMSDHVLIASRRTIDSLASTRWIAEQLTRAEVPGNFDGKESNDWASRLLEIQITGASSIDRPTSEEASAAGLVLIGDGSVSGSQAALALGIPLLAMIPQDAVGAAGLRGDEVKSRRLSRSALVGSARALAFRLIKSGPHQAPNDVYRFVPRREIYSAFGNVDQDQTSEEQYKEESDIGDQTKDKRGRNLSRHLIRGGRRKRNDLTPNGSFTPIVDEMTS